MNTYPRYKEFGIGTLCSVEHCTRLPDYEVVLYDYYAFMNETFYEQDYTCPFICQNHMEENERTAKGERRPRGNCIYLYTNRGGAQGYAKYNPIKEIYRELFNSQNLENNKEIQVDLDEVNTELIAYLAKYPEFMRQLNPRKFEELIAEILRNKGYEVTLTPKTRDGGKDIIALYKSPFGHQMFIVECKRYKEERKVGVELIRGLYGVKTAEQYNQAILVTTSTFSKSAIDFVKPLKFQLQLKDYNEVARWCKDNNKLS